MAKAKPPTISPATSASDLFSTPVRRDRKYRPLILPKFLAEEAADKKLEGEAQERAYVIIKRWAELDSSGSLLTSNEMTLDADFLNEVFVEALGYVPKTQNPARYTLARQLRVPGVGPVDGALGNFGTGLDDAPIVMIELKGAMKDLDRDKSSGLNAVDQCWKYMNGWPSRPVPWGIVSNFSTIRLYHRDKTQRAYQEFHLRDLKKRENFRQFYYLFEAGAFLPSPTKVAPRAERLLKTSEEELLEVGDKLYEYYSTNRSRLIDYLMAKHQKPLDRAIFIAQRILDRILFIAFCEKRDLLQAKSIDATYKSVAPYTRVVNPRWRAFVELFISIDKGIPGDPYLNTGYNGGLFAKNDEVDDLQIDDSFADVFQHIGTYDFRYEVNVDVLGHIFEKSIGELEQIRNAGGPLFGGAATLSTMPKSAERKKFGIYYTPPAFTEFLVKETVGQLVAEQQRTLLAKHELTAEQADSEIPTPGLAKYWTDCFAALRTLKICDPACGSGAFLIEAYEQLDAHYAHVCEHLARHSGKAEIDLLEPVSRHILRENLYGVDLSEQSVEISQLALSLRSAVPGRKLTDLSKNRLITESCG